jgi:hypothetical protein
MIPLDNCTYVECNFAVKPATVALLRPPGRIGPAGHPTRLGARRLVGAFSFSILLLPACESTDKPPANTSGNILIRDENNYQTTSTLSIPTVETAPAADLDICWTAVTKDLQCHDLAPQTDLDNVGFLRFLHLSEEQIEAKLAAGQVVQSEVDGYLDHHTDRVSTCTKLSQFSFLGTPIMIDQEYVESADEAYLMIFAKGTTPGVGARAMTFVKPTAASINTRVDAPSGCGLLNFSANITSATTLPVSLTGPWIVDWRSITRDGQGNTVLFQSIDGVLIGFFEGMTAADLQARILDIELIATALWELPLTGGRTADLSLAKQRGTDAAFPGFARPNPGVWMLGLMCSTCQNPAPVVLTILEPSAGGG